jgi:hypothetical protein
MGKEEPYRQIKRFQDLSDFHRWANKQLEKPDETAKEKGETIESHDTDAFVTQQANGIKAKHVTPIANAAVDSAGGRMVDDSADSGMEDDSDDEDDMESDEDAI